MVTCYPHSAIILKVHLTSPHFAKFSYGNSVRNREVGSRCAILMTFRSDNPLELLRNKWALTKLGSKCTLNEFLLWSRGQLNFWEILETCLEIWRLRIFWVKIWGYLLRKINENLNNLIVGNFGQKSGHYNIIRIYCFVRLIN